MNNFRIQTPQMESSSAAPIDFLIMFMAYYCLHVFMTKKTLLCYLDFNLCVLLALHMDCNAAGALTHIFNL